MTVALKTPRETSRSTVQAAAVAIPGTVEPLYRFEAQLEFHPVGLVPEGLRMTVPFEGQVTGGALADLGFEGARVWGIDHLVLRSDGVGVIDAQKTISAEDLHLLEHVRGYCTPPEGMEPPPLEAVLAPDFAWPDVAFPIQGTSTFRVHSGLQDLAHLNRAIGRIDGRVSFVTGRLEVETRILEPMASAV